MKNMRIINYGRRISLLDKYFFQVSRLVIPLTSVFIGVTSRKNGLGVL
jgi:hypothetical protein